MANILAKEKQITAISASVFFFTRTCGYFNLFVPVRSDEDRGRSGTTPCHCN